MKKEIKVGDLVTAAWKGYYRVIEIIPRYKTKEFPYLEQEAYEEGLEQGSPLFILKQEFKANGVSFPRKKEVKCDAYFCQLATEYISTEIKRLENILSNLNKITEQEK